MKNIHDLLRNNSRSLFGRFVYQETPQEKIASLAAKTVEKKDAAEPSMYGSDPEGFVRADQKAAESMVNERLGVLKGEIADLKELNPSGARQMRGRTEAVAGKVAEFKQASLERIAAIDEELAKRAGDRTDIVANLRSERTSLLAGLDPGTQVRYTRGDYRGRR